ncbi:hypothetical protein D3C80_2139250 [compost metagenome]
MAISSMLALTRLAAIASNVPTRARVRRGACPMKGATSNEASMVKPNSADISSPAWASLSCRSLMIALIRKGKAQRPSRPTP